MSKFTYMNFSDDCIDIEFVAHAKKYTKQQTIENCIAENDWRFEKDCLSKYKLRIPTEDDVLEVRIRWYIKPPWDLSDVFPDGCYSYCGDEKGSFPVYVIQFDKLMD